MIYAASPYSHHSITVRRLRYEVMRDMALNWLQQGLGIFSPIVYTHPIVVEYKLQYGFAGYLKFDTAMVRSSKELWVVKLPSWEHSIGIEGEVRIAREVGISTVHIEPFGPTWDAVKTYLQDQDNKDAKRGGVPNAIC